MSTPFYTSINLNKNEIINVSLEKLTEAPLNPVVGQIYYNTTTKKVEYYDGDSWVVIESPNFSGSYPIQVSDDGNGNLSISIAESTPTSDGYLSAADKSKLDNATSQSVSGSIVVRNSFGTFDVVNPSSETNVANKGYVDNKVSTEINNLFYDEIIGDGISNTYTVNHNLGTDYPKVSFYYVDTKENVLMDFTVSNENSIIVSSDEPLLTDEILVSVIG